MEKQKLTKDEIASILNKYSFLGHSEWRFNYDDKVFSVYYADAYLDTDIARAIAKAYLRLEAKKARNKKYLEYLRGVDQGSKLFFINGKELEGIAEGEKVAVLGDNEPIKTIISNKLGNSLIEVSITGNPDEATVAKVISGSFNNNVKEVADGLKEIFINAMGGKKDKSQSFEITTNEVRTVLDTINTESTKQKTDLDFLKESIEIVEVADSIKASIVDAMLDSKEKEIMKEIDIKGSSSNHPVVNFTENLGAFIKEQQEFLDACNKVWKLTLDILDKMKEIECLEKDTIKSIEIFEEKIAEAKKQVEVEENNKESEYQSFTLKQVSEDLASMINYANQNSCEGIQYYTASKCTAIQHIVHSGYPLVPETLTCMLNANHQTQHCATDQKGNRVNWS